jgi:thymidylate kinase
MGRGKLIVFEGIYGSGKLTVHVVNKLREMLVSRGNEVYEIDSPDGGRAQLMGAQELDGSWRYGIFKADFFFELASRARVCTVVNEELEKGKIVLCKNFTISSIVHARLKEHDWFREDLYGLESIARSFKFGVKVIPDLTVFLDIPPETAINELGDKLHDYFKPSDLVRQQEYFLEELAKLPSEKMRIINSAQQIEGILAETLSTVQALLTC